MQPLSVSSLDEELSLFVGAARRLTPAQNKLATNVISAITEGEVHVLRVASGIGRTTVLRHVHAHVGGSFLAARPFLHMLSRRSHSSLQDAFLEILAATLNPGKVVFVDDFHLIMQVAGNSIHPLVAALTEEAAEEGRRLVFAVTPEAELSPFGPRAAHWEINAFQPEDYADVAGYYLGNDASRLRMQEIHRLAPGLTADQLKHACLWMGLQAATPDTGMLIDYLRSRDLTEAIPGRAPKRQFFVVFSSETKSSQLSLQHGEGMRRK